MRKGKSEVKSQPHFSLFTHLWCWWNHVSLDFIESADISEGNFRDFTVSLFRRQGLICQWIYQFNISLISNIETGIKCIFLFFHRYFLLNIATELMSDPKLIKCFVDNLLQREPVISVLICNISHLLNLGILRPKTADECKQVHS